MQFDLFRFLFTLIESAIIILTIHLVLPRQSRLNVKSNAILYLVTIVMVYFTMYDNLLLSLLLYTVLIITISLLNRVNTYVASITIVIVFILTLVASLIATIFAIFFYTKQYDYRFILEGNQYSAMILKVIITGICVYIFKVFNSLFNRKTKIQD
jgi:hypothetical protein